MTYSLSLFLIEVYKMKFQKKSYTGVAINSFILGPIYSSIYLFSLKEKSKYFKLISLFPIFLLLIFLGVLYQYSFPSKWVWIAYLGVTILFVIHNLICHKFIYERKEIDEKEKRFSFSNGLVFGIGLSSIFMGLSWFSSILNYWIFSPFVPMDSTIGQVISVHWILIGKVIGFLYGFLKCSFIEEKRSILFKLSFFTVIYMILIDASKTLLLTYPMNKLFSLNYYSSNTSVLFYLVGALVFPVFYWFLVSENSLKKQIKYSFIMAPIIMIHLVLIGNYWNTLIVTTASVFESSGNITKAKKLYVKVIPDLDHTNFVASLKHRLGVLNLLEGNVDEAIAYFRKVVTSYKKSSKVYKKAKKYLSSYADKSEINKFKILKNNYQTFEQAASCFPNSLGYILSFYDKKQIDTRDLSFSIKEGYFSGTFIWKAESYLKKKGYSLINSYWQDGNQLIKLLDAGFPVLIYVPGHVYTVYGYNKDFEMFYTYDTARQNRWDDKPFEDLYDEWSKSSFLMSVVVKTKDETKLKDLLENILDYSKIYSLYQKSERSDYYTESKNNFYKDYNKTTFGLKLGEKGLLSKYPLYRLSADKIDVDDSFFRDRILKVISNEWYSYWYQIRPIALFLLYKNRIDDASTLVDIIESNIERRGKSKPMDFILYKMILAEKKGDIKTKIEMESRLIGDAEEGWTAYSWAYVSRIKRFKKEKRYKDIVELLQIPMTKLNFTSYYESNLGDQEIFRVLNEVNCEKELSLSDTMAQTMKLGFIFYGFDCSMQ
ncbi:MAG: hypothetical protein COB02_01385 [Candidatus Cloacimonadota bacterium]|nr:MAG: hypothetical protein COB02_01385 [Candidatus Cloacimonadota bacterium]